VSDWEGQEGGGWGVWERDWDWRMGHVLVLRVYLHLYLLVEIPFGGRRTVDISLSLDGECIPIDHLKLHSSHYNA
jgi:hypothetical protein